MRAKLSVVIPSYNTKDLLLQCIRSIYSLNKFKGNEFEVIVVDNASSDASVKLIKKEFPHVVLILNKKNLGFAKAVNKGWEISRSDLVLFLNSDTLLLSKNIISRLIKYFNKNPDVGALSAKLVLRNNKLDMDTHRGFPDPWSSFTFFTGLEKIFPKSPLFARYHMGWKNMNVIHEIDSGCGAFLLVRKKILKKINGWDEEYFFYGEDIDLCYRIKQLGWKIMFYPYIKVLHYKGASSGLRRESRDIAKTNKENLIRVAHASVLAWERFYKKFYHGKYPSVITYLVIIGIKLKGFIRILNYKYNIRL